MTLPHSVAVATLVCVLGLAGCAAPVDGADGSPDDASSSSTTGGSAPEGAAPDESAGSDAEAFLPSLAEIGGTEWTGLDDTFNDRITFIFGADGALSYRTAEGTFADPADTWSVDGDTLLFQASYGGSFGVGTHTGTYDPATGVLTVEYTTTTMRQSSYTLSQAD